MSKSSPPTSSSSSTPSFVSHIDLNEIASLAALVRDRISGSCIGRTVTVDPEPKSGAFNFVWFIDFSDNISWVLKIPIVDWSPTLEKRLKSDILGMKLISNGTNIPIPTVHDFSVGQESLRGKIGRPYILMDKVQGTRLSSLWFDKDWFTEEKRKKVWNGIARVMVQFKKFRFDKIGSLKEENGKVVVGEIIPSMYELTDREEQTADLGTELERVGPYTTARAYLFDGIRREMDKLPTPVGKSKLLLLRLFAGSLPDEEFDGPPFVLSMPDYGYQNILVNEESGEVTGLLDWDDLMTAPKQLGYARYPAWITRDWDPIMYGWPTDSDSEGEGTAQDKPVPSREELHEDSPETLQAFREEYLSAMEEVDPETAKCTRHSHIFEALDIAISTNYTRAHILEKLAKYVFGEGLGSGDPVSAWDLEAGIKSGEWAQAHL